MGIDYIPSAMMSRIYIYMTELSKLGHIAWLARARQIGSNYKALLNYGITLTVVESGPNGFHLSGSHTLTLLILPPPPYLNLGY